MLLRLVPVYMQVFIAPTTLQLWHSEDLKLRRTRGLDLALIEAQELKRVESWSRHKMVFASVNARFPPCALSHVLQSHTHMREHRMREH